MKKYLYKFLVGLSLILIYQNCLSSRLKISAGSFYIGQYGSGKVLFSMTYEEKKKEAEDRKEKLEKERQASKQKLENLKTEVNDLVSNIEILDGLMMENDLYMEKLNLEIAGKEQDLEETKALLEETKELEKKQYEAMCRRIQYMYENGSASMLEFIINADSLTDFLNQAEYFSKITEYDNNLFNSYIETKRLTLETEAILELDIEGLEELYEHAEEKRSELLVLVEEKNVKLAEYTAMAGIEAELLDNYLEEIVLAQRDIDDIIAQEQERIRIEEENRKREEEEQRKREEERRKQEERDRLNASSNVSQTNAAALGDIIWPLPGDGRVFSGFGVRVPPTAGASTYHQGVDIGGEYGAGIVASLAGTVEAAGYSVTGGNFIKINHGNSIVTAYLHCSKLLVSVGQYVKQGEVIAYVGSTGVSTGPHLHFGISINGTYVDPMNYISY